MDEKLKQALKDYVATANSGKYKSWEELNSKFPEFKNYDLKVLQDYVATANSGKYSDWDELNSKFPEFFPKSNEGSSQGSENTSVTSVEPSLPSQNISVEGGAVENLVEPPSQTIKDLEQLAPDRVLVSEATPEDYRLAEQGLRRVLVDVPVVGLGDTNLTRKAEFVIPEFALTLEPTLTEVITDGKVDYVLKYTDEDGAEQIVAERVPEVVTDKGVGSDLLNSLYAGLSQVNAMIGSIPEFLYNVASVPQNLLADAIENNAGEGSADWLRPNYSNISQGEYNPLNWLSKYAKQQRQLSEEFNSQVTQFENDIIGSLEEGNYADAGRQIANTIAASSPSILLMAMTGGAGSALRLGAIGRSTIMAIPFASGAFQEIDESTPENVRVLYSIAKGFNEILYEESFGTLPILRQLGAKVLNKPAMKEVIEGYMKQILSKNGIPASIMKGGLSEMATKLSNEIVDVYGLGIKDTIDWRGVLNDGVVGSVTDGSLSTLNLAIPDRSKRQRVNELQSQVTAIMQDIDNATSDVQIEVLENTLDSKVAELDAIVEESVDLPKPVKDQLIEISSQEQEIELMLQSENVSEESKIALQEQLVNLDNQRQQILNEQQTQSETTQEVSEVSVESGEVASVAETQGQTQEVVTEGLAEGVTDVQQTEVFTPTEQDVQVNTETEILNDTVVTDTESTQSPTELEVEGEIVTPTQQKLQEIRDKRERIKQRIRAKYGTLNTGINPEQIKDYVELGATYIQEGVVRFEDFIKRLQDDFKDNPKLFDKLKDKDLREIFRQSVEANGLKIRGFVNTALDSPKVSETTKTILEQTSEELTYTPQVYSEIEERLSQTSEADKLAKIGQLSRITGELKDSDNDAILAGISLINQYEAEGRYDESAKVMEQMAKSATVIAQALRQYGEFKNSTPKGYIQLVETMLKEKGKELNPTNRAKIEQLFNEFQRATENFKKESENIGNDISKEARKKYLEAEIALEKANKELSDYVGRLYGKDTGNLLSQIMQGNLLTLKSLIINPFSNIVQATVRASQNSVAWLLDQMFTLSVGQGSKIAPWDVDAIRLGTRGVKEGTQKAWRKAVYGDASTELNKYDVNKRLKPFTAMSDLVKTLTSEDFRQEFPQTSEDILNNVIESTLGVPANLMFRMLPFGDDPFFQVARVWRLVEIGKKNKKLSGEALEKFVNKPDEKSNLEAIEYAKSATFQDATGLAKFVRGIMNSVQDVISSKTTGIPYIGKTIDATSKVLIKGLIPFVGTPSSILQKTIRFAVPLIPTIEFGYNLSQYAKVVGRKGVKSEDAINWQRKIVESAAEVAVSGAVISVAMTLVSLKLASGDAPEEQERAKERNFMFNTMPPNHLNISGLKRLLAGGDPTYRQGDRTVSYMPLGLLGAQIGIVESTMGTKLREEVKKSKVLTTEGKPFYEVDKSKGLLSYMLNISDNIPASLKYFMSQSIVQSSNTLLEAISTGEYDQFGNQMVRTLGSLGIPNQVSQYFRATNEYMRDIYTEEDLQTWANIIKEKVANVEDLPIRYNMWGEPVTQTPKGENPYVYQMLDIFRSQKILEDDLTYKVFDLFKRTHDTTVIPTSARDFFKEGDFTVKLNKHQKAELTRLVGERRRVLAERVMRSYTKDVEKPERYVERLRKAYSNGAKQGKAVFMKQLRDQGINIRANINLHTQDEQVELETSGD